MKQLLCALPMLFAASCALPTVKSVHSAPDKAPTQQTNPQVQEAQPRAWASTPVAEPQLYSRDGTPVGVQEPGTVAVSPRTGQSSGQEEGSRWTLLEQYQDAITAKEELEFEVGALGNALDQAEAQTALLSQASEEMRAQMAMYEQRIEELKSENLELASRLTTAQVRRLQSEKLLLEAKLDWSRVQAVINQPDDPMSPGAKPTEAGSTRPGTPQQP
jgi:hypothetical protein